EDEESRLERAEGAGHGYLAPLLEKRAHVCEPSSPAPVATLGLNPRRASSESRRRRRSSAPAPSTCGERASSRPRPSFQQALTPSGSSGCSCSSLTILLEMNGCGWAPGPAACIVRAQSLVPVRASRRLAVSIAT